MQKSNFPYAGFNIKDTKEYAICLLQPIYEPGVEGDFGTCQVAYIAGLRVTYLQYFLII